MAFLVSDKANYPSLFYLYMIQFYQVCTQCKERKRCMKNSILLRGRE